MILFLRGRHQAQREISKEARRKKHHKALEFMYEKWSRTSNDKQDADPTFFSCDIALVRDQNRIAYGPNEEQGMSSAEKVPLRMTVDEYLTSERDQTERHEYWAGEDTV